MCSSQTQAASLNTTAMAKTARNREKGDSGRCKKQRSMQLYSRQRRNPNKGKTLAPKLVAQSEVAVTVSQPATSAEPEQPASETVQSAADVAAPGSDTVFKIAEIDSVKSNSPSGFRYI